LGDFGGNDCRPAMTVGPSEKDTLWPLSVGSGQNQEKREQD
jgi:hypothetical protein